MLFIYFQSRITFSHCIWSIYFTQVFYLDSVPPFYFLKGNHYFSACENLPCWKVQVSFSSNVASIFSATKHSSSVLFLVQKLYTLVKRSQLKCKFLRHLNIRIKICQIVVSILKRHVSSSSNLASFFIVMTQNSSVNFKLIHFLLWIKGFHQKPNLEFVRCSSENLSYSSYHFPNHKSAVLQILYHSAASLSRKITHLDFFRSNVIYLA